jgi:cytochrome c-type biogenesis protein
MGATGLGSTLQDHRELLNRIAGGLIVAMGLLFLASLVAPRLNRQWRPQRLLERAGTGGPVIAGAAFAIGWTPCIGPTLTVILNAAALEETVGQGGVLLAVYSLGLAVPFLLSAVAFQRASTVFRWLRDRYVAITGVAAVVLVAMGVLIFTGEITQLNVEAQRLLDAVGLGDLYSV